MGKHEWTTIADAINEEIVPALGEYADDYDVNEIADRFLAFDGRKFRPAILADDPDIDEDDAGDIVADEFWRIVEQCEKSDDDKLEDAIAKDVEEAWDGEGYYEIAFSDGGQPWTNEGPLCLETAEELADELRAAYGEATETHLPYAEKVEAEISAAQFRATREMLGLSQQDVADAVEVDRRSVKRWESGEYPVPDDVAEWLMEGKASADYTVRNVVKDILSSEFPPATVSLTYYRTQEEYDEHGRDDGPFGISNANARRVADALEAEGIACKFCYPGESEEVETAKAVTR